MLGAETGELTCGQDRVSWSSLKSSSPAKGCSTNGGGGGGGGGGRGGEEGKGEE